MLEEDAGFQNLVVADPKKMLESFLGQRLPNQSRIFVHEDDQDTMHLTIPPSPRIAQSSPMRSWKESPAAPSLPLELESWCSTAASFSMEALSPEVEKGSW